MKIICFGPGPVFKGGISNYNTSLAKAFDKLGVETHIVSWTQQYPAIIPRDFKDKTSKTDLLAGTHIKVQYITDYNNPLTWKETYDYIVGLKPDKVIFQWSIALQGLPLSYITRKLKKHKEIEVIYDLHFVIQKEHSGLDKYFTKLSLQHADTYIAHAYKTVDELKQIFPNLTYHVSETGERKTNMTNVIKLYHPVYDLFQPDPNFDIPKFKQEHHLKEHVFFYFGFIRKYKGLHNAIKAFHQLSQQRDDVSFLICGESFWNTLDNNKVSTKIKNLLFGIAKKVFLKKQDDEKDYNPLQLIDELGLQDKVMLVNEYIPNEDVHQYFQVADCGVLFYETATPSGVESLNYNFKLPILVTRVGHFPETIKDGFNGYIAEPEDINSMAKVMQKFLDLPIDRRNVEESAKDMSWDNYAKTILAGSSNKG
jgi:glycosyltransferase involved in cell wall biosynthesis